jgi:hypothetical protein
MVQALEGQAPGRIDVQDYWGARSASEVGISGLFKAKHAGVDLIYRDSLPTRPTDGFYGQVTTVVVGFAPEFAPVGTGDGRRPFSCR